MSTIIYEFQSLLKLYEMYGKIVQTRPTFMQISGYPHFENVCSNVLQFYLKPDNCHGLKDLLLTALMISVNKYPNSTYFQDTNVEREYMTSVGNRIDLLITTNKYVIGIENKIYSGIHNNLDDYSKTIDTISNHEGKEAVKIVLTIRDESNLICSSGTGFINITYKSYLYFIERLLSQYIYFADNTYLLYFVDFIKTIKSIYGGIPMDIEKISFFRENESKIMSLISETSLIKDELRKVTTELSNLIDISELEKAYPHVRKWFYKENDGIFDTLVYDITGIRGTDKTLAIDIDIDLNGWTISSFLRGGDISVLKAIFDSNRIISTINLKTGRLDIGKFPFDEKLDIISSKVYEFLMKVKDIC